MENKNEDKKAKFYVDLKKLKNNILSIKYSSTKNYKLSPIAISEATKDVINDIIKHEFNKRIYDKLNHDEQKIIIRFVNIMDYDINIKDDGLEKLYNDFEIMRGEYMAGNDSIIVKKQLRSMIMDLMNRKRIPQFKAFQMMFELSL